LPAFTQSAFIAVAKRLNQQTAPLPKKNRTSPVLNYPIVQIAYFVNDARKSAKKMSKQFGAGPFFFIPRIELAWGKLRGEDCNFLHSSAFGQWGDVMVEFVQQDEEGPSPFRELYAPGEEGIHHVAMMVDSMEQTYVDCAK
jgi:hypothetical protein